jgi:hypothetical protein
MPRLGIIEYTPTKMDTNNIITESFFIQKRQIEEAHCSRILIYFQRQRMEYPF